MIMFIKYFTKSNQVEYLTFVFNFHILIYTYNLGFTLLYPFDSLGLKHDAKLKEKKITICIFNHTIIA